MKIGCVISIPLLRKKLGSWPMLSICGQNETRKPNHVVMTVFVDYKLLPLLEVSTPNLCSRYFANLLLDSLLKSFSSNNFRCNDNLHVCVSARAFWKIQFAIMWIAEHRHLMEWQWAYSGQRYSLKRKCPLFLTTFCMRCWRHSLTSQGLAILKALVVAALCVWSDV